MTEAPRKLPIALVSNNPGHRLLEDACVQALSTCYRIPVVTRTPNVQALLENPDYATVAATLVDVRGYVGPFGHMAELQRKGVAFLGAPHSGLIFDALAKTVAAAGFITVDEPLPMLAKTLRRTARGKSPITPLVQKMAGQLPPTFKDLTPRMTEVAYMRANGMQNTEIAKTLGISVDTVEAHIDHIQDRLNVSDSKAFDLWLHTVFQPVEVY
jgi:hypothetical protein